MNKARKDLVVMFATLLSLTGESPKPITTSDWAPRGTRSPAKDKPKRRRKRGNKGNKSKPVGGLTGAARHARSEIAKMTEQVVATYEQHARYCDKDGAAWFYALTENAPSIDWSADEQEVMSNVLLTHPATVNLMNGAGRNAMAGLSEQRDGSATLCPANHPGPQYNSSRKQGNVWSF